MAFSYRHSADRYADILEEDDLALYCNRFSDMHIDPPDELRCDDNHNEDHGDPGMMVDPTPEERRALLADILTPEEKRVIALADAGSAGRYSVTFDFGDIVRSGTRSWAWYKPDAVQGHHVPLRQLRQYVSEGEADISPLPGRNLAGVERRCPGPNPSPPLYL
ncbi:hypothetical protein NMY22_g989 [Coprinellus aureogranulatus]|nr:hypothetical protein NMY22_g989 [Coprinellus aureogranulatus]